MIKKYKYLIMFLFYVASSILCAISLLPTKYAQMDLFLTQLNVPNEHNYYNGFVSPYVKIKKNENQIIKTGSRYLDLLNTFYYDSLTSDCRELIDNKTSVGLLDDLNIQLMTQTTYRILNDPTTDGFFPIDQNMYYSYFSSEMISEFVPSPYQPRFGCDSFIYISDTLADKLIQFYGLEDIENPYLELIKKEEYAVLYLDADNIHNATKVSINTVVSSRHRFGVGASKIYGDFGILNINGNNKAVFNSFSFDVGMKVNQFGNKKTLETIDSLGYKTNNSSFMFYTFDYANEHYIHSNELDNQYQYVQSLDDNTITYFYVLVVVFSIALLFLSFVPNQFLKINKWLFLSCYFLFAAYGVVANFVAVCPLVSIFPIVGLVFITIFYSKGVLKSAKYIATSTEYFAISI